MDPHALGSTVEGWIGWLILLVVAIAGLLDVLRAFGFLPERLSKIIGRNRLADNLEMLRSFGIDVDSVRRRTTAGYLEEASPTVLVNRVASQLKPFKVNRHVTVGGTIRVGTRDFFDLMGACADEATARAFARDLAAHWRQLILPGGQRATDQIEFIVTPKIGTPLLGSAFATLIKKPLLLHNAQEKFASEQSEMRAHFDCLEIPPSGTRALIVDDSSTGGEKVLAAVKDLRRFGYQVSDVLVVFEPQLKTSTGQNAAQRLKPEGVTLHSIIQV